jgi:hypothetical protein
MHKALIWLMNKLRLKGSNMIQESRVLVLKIVFFSFICLLKDFTAHELVTCLVCNIHMSTSHGET